MIKKVLLFVAAVLCSASLFAQSGFVGGVKGTVVNRAGRAPISSAQLTLSQQGEVVATATADAEGKFLVDGLANGIYDITVTAPGFLDAHVNVTVVSVVVATTFAGAARPTGISGSTGVSGSSPSSPSARLSFIIPTTWSAEVIGQISSRMIS